MGCMGLALRVLSLGLRVYGYVLVGGYNCKHHGFQRMSTWLLYEFCNVQYNP